MAFLTFRFLHQNQAPNKPAATQATGIPTPRPIARLEVLLVSPVLFDSSAEDEVEVATDVVVVDPLTDVVATVELVTTVVELVVVSCFVRKVAAVRSGPYE